MNDAPMDVTALSYTQAARALFRDYYVVYAVDLETEKYICYRRDGSRDVLVREQEGEGFFAYARKGAPELPFPDDRQSLTEIFRREYVQDALRRSGVFSLTYRRFKNGATGYVHVKAVPLEGQYILCGFCDVDEQIRLRETRERIRAEQITYARIAALSGNYVCIYTVDPATDRYTQYLATKDLTDLGMPGAGEDFFGTVRRGSERSVYPEDREMFLSLFTREKVMEEIRRSGLFALQCRLLLGGKPRYVNIRAALVEEADGPQLVVGANNIDAQIRREMTYAHALSVARSAALVDALTGVKNTHAYADAEAELDRQLAEDPGLEFAIVMFDVNGLKRVNDTLGHLAGDQLLRDACSLICDIFKHSPVFRVGGDEFAVIARGQDYRNIDRLTAQVAESNERNLRSGGVVVACGVSRCGGDASVASVFARADKLMYENKRQLEGRGG